MNSLDVKNKKWPVENGRKFECWIDVYSFEKQHCQVEMIYIQQLCSINSIANFVLLFFTLNCIQIWL